MTRTPSTQKLLEACPNRNEHTEGPPGYLQWHEWAERTAETHTQSRCAGCGLFLIWAPRKRP